MKRKNGYFTVEAALVLPIVIGVIILLIYLIFFQYNRCLMELDAGALALKGCIVQEEDKNVLMQVLKKYEKEIERKKYIMWSQNDMTVTLEKGIVKVEGTGGLDFPFFNMYEGNVNGFWSTSTGYENHRIDPVSFMRTYRKITGGE